MLVLMCSDAHPDSDMTDYMNSSSRNELEETFLSTGFTKWPPVVGTCSCPSESFTMLLCALGTLSSKRVESDALKQKNNLFAVAWPESEYITGKEESGRSIT